MEIFAGMQGVLERLAMMIDGPGSSRKVVAALAQAGRGAEVAAVQGPRSS